MKKRLFSLLCALTLLLGAVPSAAALEGESQRAAEVLAALGLIGGVPSAKALSAPASRDQAAEVLVRLQGLTEEDLPSGAYDHAADQGWIARAGRRGPIPASEFCAGLLRQLGYEGFTEEDAAVFARRIALTARDYGETLTLGGLCQLVRDALVFPDAEGRPLARRLADEGLCAPEQIQDLFPEELNARQIADRHMAAVFRLDIYYTERAYRLGQASNGGSAFFISADGLAVTNCHAIDGAVLATATLITGETFPVERVLFYDYGADLALLKISQTSADGETTAPLFSYLELAGEPDLRRGDCVYTLGVPLGITPAVSQGIISATDHHADRFSVPCIINTADISHGSSGGALLNVYGRVVGVTSGAYQAGNSLYISVPLDLVLEADWEAEGLTLKEAAAQREAQG
nr:serine protease [uncultured Oscillibacter sp.]